MIYFLKVVKEVNNNVYHDVFLYKLMTAFNVKIFILQM